MYAAQRMKDFELEMRQYSTALELLRPDGVLGYKQPNDWMTSEAVKTQNCSDMLTSSIQILAISHGILSSKNNSRQQRYQRSC